MTIRTSLLWIILVVGAILPVTWSASQSAAMKTAFEVATRRLSTATSRAQQITDLRSQQQRIAVSQRPAQDVIARVYEIVGDVGIARNRVKNVLPEGNAALPSAGSSSGEKTQYYRQSVRLLIDRVTVADLGNFLTAWRESQPIWTATRIELSHSRDRSATAGAYDVTIVLTCIYIEDGGAS